jgi:hypothetical protein
MPRGADSRFDQSRVVRRSDWEPVHGEAGGGPDPAAFDGAVGWEATATPTEDGRFLASAVGNDATMAADAYLYGGEAAIRLNVPKSYRTQARALMVGEALGKRLAGQAGEGYYDYGMRSDNYP